MITGDIYKKAAEKFGMKAQLIAALEELSECSTEIAKYLNNKHKGSLENLAKEVADVEIMMEQVKFNLKINSEVDYWISFKLNRLKTLLDQPGESHELKNDATAES